MWNKLLLAVSLPLCGLAVCSLAVRLKPYSPFQGGEWLTFEQWQAIANSNTDPFIRVALEEQGIKPHRDPWIAVDSSCINAIAYLDIELLLKICFNSGLNYQYKGVPHNIFLDLLDANSKGAECTAKQALELNSRACLAVATSIAALKISITTDNFETNLSLFSLL